MADHNSDSSEPLSPRAASVLMLKEDLERKIDRLSKDMDRKLDRLASIVENLAHFRNSPPPPNPLDPTQAGPSNQYIPPTPQPPPPHHHSAPPHSASPPNPNPHHNDPPPPPPFVPPFEQPIPPPPPSPRNHPHNGLEEEDRMSMSHDSELEFRGRRGRVREEDDRGLKIDLPEFEGGTNPDEYVDWVHDMERVFDYKEYSDGKRFKLAILKFKGYATLWWRKVKKHRENEEKSEIRTWSKLKKVMDKRFLPKEYKQDLYHKLHGLRQERKSVGDYIRDFEQLMIRCDIPEPKEHTIARFISGLNREIANIVDLQQYKSLDDVYKLALKIEKQKATSRVAVFKPNVRDEMGFKGGTMGNETLAPKPPPFERDKGKTEEGKALGGSR